jgi:hypothetical protein
MFLLLPALLACQEYALHEPDPVLPAQPPDPTEQGFGDAPNWADCDGGWLGRYANLAIDHPDVEPDPQAVASTNPDELDWWDDLAFEQYEASLDYGRNWWPVDEGLEEDPSYFAAWWVAWLRVTDDTQLTFVLGSSDDAWVFLDNTELVSLPGVHSYEEVTPTIDIDSGQYPIIVRYAHRADDNGFRFRILSGDVSLCYPSFGTD